MSEPAFALNKLQVQVVAGFLEQMRAQGHDVAGPVETPKKSEFRVREYGVAAFGEGKDALDAVGMDD